MRTNTLWWRLLTVTAVLATVLAVQPIVAPTAAEAVSPPPASLPDCVDNGDGTTSGACPRTSDQLSIAASGSVAPGSTVDVTLNPSIPPCNTLDRPDGWSPALCFSSVAPTRATACGYIDIRTDEFTPAGCTSLYLNGAADFSFDTSSSSYSTGVPIPHPGCGATTNFDFWYWGKNGTEEKNRWASSGLTALECSLTFTGSRPDGLYGPSWVRFSTSIAVQRAGVAGSTSETVDVYVPIDGDLRNLGPVADFEIDQLEEQGTLRFRNTSTHTNSLTMTYSWEFGDGATSTATSPEHTYTDIGEFTVTLTATDGEKSDETSKTVIVTDLFRWQMAPRFEPDEATGELPYRWTRAEINPDDFVVQAVLADQLCGAEISLTVDAQTIDVIDKEGCDFSFALPEGEFEVTVEADGEAVGDVSVTIDDLLIVVIGDSIASGEGLGGDGPWIGPTSACHRAAEPAGALAAQQIEEGSDATSVTFVNLACSGASIEEGLLSPQHLLTAGKIDQLALMDSLIDREIDALIINGGANDLAFGDILSWCVATADDDGYDCSDLYFSYVTRGEAARLGLFLSGARNPTPFTTSTCDAIEVGDTELAIKLDVFDATDTSWTLFRNDPRGWTLNVNPLEFDYSNESTKESRGPSLDITVEEKEFTTTNTCESLVNQALTFPTDFPIEHALPPRLGVGQLPQRRGGQIQPVFPAVAVVAPTMDEWVAIAVEDLESNLGLLDARLDSFEVAETFLVEYPDELTDSAGETCDNILAQNNREGLSLDETEWARDEFLGELNQALHRSASAAGWTYIGGIQDSFIGHGYCAEGSRWVNTLSDSLREQSDPFGAMHPNSIGHEIIATQIVDGIRGELDSAAPIPYDGFVPAPRGVLEELATAGDWRLRMDSNGFRIGDVVIIAPGAAEEETVIVGGFGSLVLTQPLQYNHPANTVVVRSRSSDIAAVLTSFGDVPAGVWYEESVRWASAGAITTGTAPGVFSPESELTRAQLFTLLWRAMGSPSSTVDVPFTDLRPGSFYEEAARWAYEFGITTGTSATTFSPDQAGTRAQVATVLWRLAGSPDPGTDRSFGDVLSGRFYTAAIAWLLDNGLTTGVGPDRWAPDLVTNRAMAVTFMYRLARADFLGIALS